MSALPAWAHRTLVRLISLPPEAAPSARPSDSAFLGARGSAAPALPAIPVEQAMEIIEAALATTPGKGDACLPENLALLAALLGPKPAAPDFTADDMVRECFASLGPAAQKSRALLAVALRLSREFGLPNRMPLATARAWRMLEPAIFEDEMAAQLGAISSFISDWQKTQQTFLCLEFPEIELIEFLFESVSPLRHSDAMYEVLNFKALSNRRQGILRRIPHRLRKFVQSSGPTPGLLVHVEATQTFLDRVAVSHGYAPIVDAATTSLEEVKKIAEKLLPPAAIAAPPGAPPGEGQPLARIMPVKRPASELADQAMAAAPPAPSPAPAPVPPPAIAPTPRPAAVTIPRPAAAPPATRRAIAPSQRFSTIAAPMKMAGGISSVGKRGALSVLGATPAPLIPGKRPPLPIVAMGVLPVLAHGSAAPAPSLPRPPSSAGSVTGRIAIPPSAPAAPTAPSGSVTGSARGRVVIPPPRPTPAPPAAPVSTAPVTAAPVTAAPVTAAPVTDLTVVPTSKRPPITQAIKRQSVLKVLRGESSSAIAAALGIRESKLDEWVDAFITAGVGALSPTPRKASRPRKDKAADSAPLSPEVLRAKLAEVLATAQLIERAMEAQLQPRRPVLLPPPDGTSGSHHSTKRPRKKG